MGTSEERGSGWPMRYCTTCGTAADSADAFCSSCGTRLRQRSEVRHPAQMDPSTGQGGREPSDSSPGTGSDGKAAIVKSIGDLRGFFQQARASADLMIASGAVEDPKGVEALENVQAACRRVIEILDQQLVLTTILDEQEAKDGLASLLAGKVGSEMVYKKGMFDIAAELRHPTAEIEIPPEPVRSKPVSGARWQTDKASRLPNQPLGLGRSPRRVPPPSYNKSLMDEWRDLDDGVKFGCGILLFMLFSLLVPACMIMGAAT